MESRENRLPQHLQGVLERFASACQGDGRVTAAFIYGSYASGTADVYSDLDLGLITADEEFDSFVDDRHAFVAGLGEPLFLEDFGYPDLVFAIFADGAEVEVRVGRESQFTDMHPGAYRALLDKKGILAGAVFRLQEVDVALQQETLRRLVASFWHDLSHFIAAIGRGQLWWAYGQLEVLRLMCVNLARLQQAFTDPGAGEEAYFKVEQAVPAERLAGLRESICLLEREAMLRAAAALVRFYRDVAPPLAREHGIGYPQALERLMTGRLEKLGGRPS